MEEEDRYALSGLLIRGKDEKGFECIYNQENFIRKINISAEKISGKFDVDDVKKNIQRETKELADVKTK